MVNKYTKIKYINFLGTSNKFLRLFNIRSLNLKANFHLVSEIFILLPGCNFFLSKSPRSKASTRKLVGALHYLDNKNNNLAYRSQLYLILLIVYGSCIFHEKHLVICSWELRPEYYIPIFFDPHIIGLGFFCIFVAL